MTVSDPEPTQCDQAMALEDELEVAGFDDAEEIGRGGFGVVYRCLQRSLGRTVAVKVLAPDFDPDSLARFLREQHAMGKLSGHPNIVPVFQVGTAVGGSPYIVMQYHAKGSLESRVRTLGPLDWTGTLKLGIRLAGALETAHRIGILHRDIKPANVLLTDYGEPQLTDFGIAHVTGAFETSAGSVTGSPAYTAPEVLTGKPPSPASDVYGLGATLFCALTGHAAYERRTGERVVAQFLRITSEPVPDLRLGGIPDDVCVAIENAMAALPDDRPRTAAEFGRLLQGIEGRHRCTIDDMAVPNDASDPAAKDTTGAANDSKPAPPEWSPSQRAEGTIPFELTSFVGRGHEIATTKALLSTSRLVTLAGSGGVGKTRLALRVAAESEHEFDDGVWLVEFGKLQDPALLANFMANVLGVREQPGRSQQQVLEDHLAARHALLVLDNCEHLIDPIAASVQRLLRTCPHLHFLLTSREPLGIGGESVLRVPPLGLPGPAGPVSGGLSAQSEAVALFCQRATAALPDFDLDDDNLAVVAKICHQLDGLPLAIELAAARLRAMSAEQILDRLADRYRLLTRGDRSAPDRQQTLLLCSDWSYDLCTAQERALWSQLSVFAGDFDLEAAEDVCSLESTADDLLDVVAQLVDKSILLREQHGTGVRYRLLQTLRDYGLAKLRESGDEARLRARHLDFYERLALHAEAEWISPRQLVWIARLEREQPNLREALESCLRTAGSTDRGMRFASALYPFWSARGLISEGRRWLDATTSAHGDDAGLTRVRALRANSVLAGLQGQFAQATEMVDEAKRLAEQLKDPQAQAFSSFAEGLLAVHTADLSRAARCLDSALTVFRQSGDVLRVVEALVILALVSERRDDTDRAIACNEEVLAITELHGESCYRTHSLWSLGLAVWHTEPGRGVDLLQEGLRLARVVAEPMPVAWCLEILSWVAASDDRHERAAVLMGAADTLWQKMGGPSVDINALHPNHGRYQRQVRSALGESAFNDGFRRGAGLTQAAAAAYALEEGRADSPAI